MAIPVYLQNIKSAGVYKIVFDKSTVLNQDTNILRLLVGYSDKGPFNIPTYIQSVADFIAMYGNINKTQERRGNFFHRTAIQMLATSPILCLNLKKFDGETVTGAQIDTNFNAKNAIDTVTIPVEDVYDTTRFWSLDPEKLNEVRGAEYINIATTDVKTNSGTFFIRKASGSKVSSYNVTVSDWYKDAGEEVPEFLEGYENELMSAFFAEVYVFGGRFTADQVLASDTLKNYFIVGSDGKLKLRQYVKDSFGDYNDTLDYLYDDETSGAIGHYVGCLIPNFKDKNGNYASLDILFNVDSDAHHMMMSFNEDMLYEYGTANIDMSGARWISTSDTTPYDNAHKADKSGSDVGHDRAKLYKQYGTSIICIDRLWEGTALTSLLGNANAPVVSAKTHFRTNIWSDEDTIKHKLAYNKTKKITGNMYVQSWTTNAITLGAVGTEDKITIDLQSITGKFDVNYILYQLGAAYKKTTTVDGEKKTEYVPYESGLGTYYKDVDAYNEPENIDGPKRVITSLSRDLDSVKDNIVILSSDVVKCNTEEVYITTKTEYLNPDTVLDENKYTSWNVYGPSVTFIPLNDNWTLEADVYDETDEDAVHTYHLTAPATADSSVLAMLQKGDQFLAVDGTIDMDGDGDYDDEVINGYYDLCYVQETETVTDENGVPTKYSIKFTGNIAIYEGKSSDSSKDEIIDKGKYDLIVDPNEKADYTPYSWAVSYKKIGEKEITAEVYDAIAENKRTGFNLNSCVFVKQVNAAEYMLMNANAQAMCTRNTRYVKKGDDQKISAVDYAKLTEADKANYTFEELDTYTFVYNKVSEVIVNPSNKEGLVQITAGTGVNVAANSYIKDTYNHELNVDKTVNVFANLKYDGTDTMGYYAYTYKNDAYDFGTVVEVLKDAEYQKIRPIAETDKAYTDNPTLYTIGVALNENGAAVPTAKAYLKGYSEMTANAQSYIKKGEHATTTYGKYLVRIENGLNQEIGSMEPIYLKGYTYEHPKPDGTGQRAKLDWQNYQLSALTEYKGLRTGLLNKSEIDYRYVIDGFETYVDAGAKKVLTYLAKQKQSAFAILNFPAVKTFTKCPYTSFTDAKGVFNVQYVVDGYNKKKAHTTAFSLPSNDEGASFGAFYTPLKLSDGTIDSVVPSAGLVSNLFMEKYNSRQPYEIVAGPNYGAMSVSGLVGPDYNYSSDELNIIEPFGVNCMVYRPSFGTFINANQTAKQTPKSALSSVNVRELVIYLMDEVEKVLQSYQWEFNNQTVRNKIKDRADAICARVAANGGIQAYLNVMDDSNNTPDIIDNEMAILSTHIEPGRGMGKMVHELTLYRTGQMSSSVLGE